ncbi:MAG TPA: TonB family protein [Allosphingosinicella sp.]|nr:TonB family protein [Allosphingosinicella sp.]
MSRRRLALAAAAITLAGAPAAARTARSLYIAASDTPAGVTRGPAELRLRVRYELAGDGSVANCTILRSSRRPAIDAATCAILRERARIRPSPYAASGELDVHWDPPSPDDANGPGAPIPLGFVETISPDDYPREAVRNRESGVLKYEVDVSENGVPLACTVTESSGSAALDRRTCDLVMTRAMFVPASDGAGGRRRGVYRSRFRWVIP